MENVDELEKRLNIAKAYGQIINHIENAECPICHNKSLVYKQRQYGSPDYNGGWHAEINCQCCRIIKAETDISGYNYYHMNTGAAGELQMLQTTYNKIKPYI